MTAEQAFPFPFLFLVACFVLTFSSSSPTYGHRNGQNRVTLTNPVKLVQEAIKCKNEQGKDVDWFIVYKLPKNKTSSNELVREGLAYAYILPNANEDRDHEQSKSKVKIKIGISGSGSGNDKTTHKEGEVKGPFDDDDGGQDWILSEKGIHSPDSMIGLSIEKMFKNNQDVAFLTYNDQPPIGPTVESGGHSKGIIVTSLASGFWIQHSVPHFPLILKNNYNYTYPSTGKNNGQVLHCISLPSTKDVDDLGRIFQITKPHVVNFSFPTDQLKNALLQLTRIVEKHKKNHNPQENDDDPCTNEIDVKGCLLIKQLKQKKNWDQMEIRSGNGQTFKAYAKGPSFHEEIYSSQLAPTYRTPLVVQSWLNGPNPFESNCSSASFPVYNVQQKQIAGHEFSTHNDHSKWALSNDQKVPLICISDLNRMEHQLKRGGVVVCFTDPRVWMTFNKSIIDVQPCPRLPDDDDRNSEQKEKVLAQEDVETSSSSLIVAANDDDGGRMEQNYNENQNHTTSYLRKVMTRSYSFVKKLFNHFV